MADNLDEFLKEDRVVSYNTECIRKKSNWSKSSANYKLDSDTFDPEMLLNDIPERSPKLEALLKNVTELDKSDMKRDGHMYKHFIFCDVKSGGQGARMLAAAFIASGFHLGYGAKMVDSNTESKSIDDNKRNDTPRPSELSDQKESKFKSSMEDIEEGDESMEGGKKKEKRFQKLEMYDMPRLKRTANKNFYLLSSVDVFEQPISVKMKKEILLNFNKRPSNVHGKEARFIIMDSGFKEGIDLFDIKYVHIFEPSVNASDQKQVIGRGTRTCGQKGLTFHPTRGWALNVFIYDMSIPETLRGQFLDSDTTFDLYIKSLNLDIRLARFAADLEETSIYGAVDYELNRDVHAFKIGDLTTGGGPKRIHRRLIVDNKPPLLLDSTNSSLQVQLPSGQMVSGMESKPMGFKDMREYINRFFSDSKWTDVKMENMCEDLKKGGASQMEYTPTQRFVQKYFTPQSPVNGMLLWHSTGTGKTCSAIASATSSFDPQGYTILWVTRTTLKNDIWKNMFDQICNEQIRKMVADGVTLPEQHAKRMKLLSKAWRIRPISYKQFSNLVSKENNYYKQLVDINGPSDPLRKTLLIIDEAHKLYGGGDLSSLERPDMKALHGALMNSYAVSGRDSVRLMLMTATPITENPMELVKLVNLCKPVDDQIPDEFATFSNEFLTEDGAFTSEGRRKYLDEIAGHISYLNREKDARQFAQPHLKRILVPIVKDVKTVEEMDKRYMRASLSKEVQDLKASIIQENEKIDEDMKDLDSSRFYELRDVCEQYDGIVKKGCVKIATGKIRELVKEARTQIKHIKDTVKGIREEVKNKNLYRKDALQQIGEHIKENPEKLAEFKKGMYYTLKYECGKTVTTNAKMEELALEHPQVGELVAEISAYDKRGEDLDNELKVFVDAHKKRTTDMRKMLRSWELNDLERLVVKMSIKDEQKQYRQTHKIKQKNITNEKGDLSKTRKSAQKRMKKTMRNLKSKAKEYIKENKQNIKEQKRAEKELRKTMRKQGDIREEIKDGVLKDLMTKYKSEIKVELDNNISDLQEAADKKESAKKIKEDAKEKKRSDKEDAKTKNKKEKEIEKNEKRIKKDDDRNAKTLKKAQEKAAKASLRATKKIHVIKIKKK